MVSVSHANGGRHSQDSEVDRPQAIAADVHFRENPFKVVFFSFPQLLGPVFCPRAYDLWVLKPTCRHPTSICSVGLAGPEIGFQGLA